MNHNRVFHVFNSAMLFERALIHKNKYLGDTDSDFTTQIIPIALTITGLYKDGETILK